MRINKNLKEDWEDIKKKPLKNLGILLKEFIIYFIISLIILYFLSRPVECKLKNNTTIHIEDYKFNYKNVTKCEITTPEDAKQIYKALTTRVIYEEEEQQKWNYKIINQSN